MQSALSHAAAAAPAQAQGGRATPRRPARLAARVACNAVQTAAAPEAATGAVKLPATHLASSAAALQQLKATSVNREWLWAARSGLGWRESGPGNHPLGCSGYGSLSRRPRPPPRRLRGPLVQHWRSAAGGMVQLARAAPPPPPLQPVPTRPAHPPPAAGYAMEKKSSIIAIGLTVHNAPVELREKLAVPEAEWQRAIEELCSYPHIEEAAVLSTCNRMEIYVVAVSFHRGVCRGEQCSTWGEAGAGLAVRLSAASGGHMMRLGHRCSVPARCRGWLLPTPLLPPCCLCFQACARWRTG